MQLTEMKGKQAALFFTMFFVILLTASSSSDRTLSTGYLGTAVKNINTGKNHTSHVLVQNIRSGHGHGGSGSSGEGGSHGDGNGDSSTPRQPGRPPNGAGTADSRNHHRNGAGIPSPTCNFVLLILAISMTLFFIWGDTVM